MVVISVSLSAQELKEFEKVASQAGFSSRSDAVRDALARFVSANNWANGMEGKVSCALSIVYSDRKKLHVRDRPPVLGHRAFVDAHPPGAAVRGADSP